MANRCENRSAPDPSNIRIIDALTCELSKNYADPFAGTSKSMNKPITSGPIPKDNKPFDLTLEVKNLAIWPNRKGLTYYLSFDNRQEIIMAGEDSKRNPILVVVYAEDTEWPMYREPTCAEIKRFTSVAKYMLPDSRFTKRLKSIDRKKRNLN